MKCFKVLQNKNDKKKLIKNWFGIVLLILLCGCQSNDLSNENREEEAEIAEENIVIEDEIQKTNLKYDYNEFLDSVKRYEYYENPYYLEGISAYIEGFNVVYTNAGSDNKASVMSATQFYKELGYPDNLINQIIGLEGIDVIKDSRFVLIEEKMEEVNVTSLFKSDAEMTYYEVSSVSKENYEMINGIKYFYIGGLKEKRPHGEGRIFQCTESGIRLQCIGTFEMGQLSGTAILFSNEEFGDVFASIGDYEKNMRMGWHRIFGYSDIIDTYSYYKAAYLEYKVNYFEKYTKNKQYEILSDLLRNPMAGELMLAIEEYKSDSPTVIRANYPIITPIVKYTGNYKDDVFDGEGTLYTELGNVWYSGEFENNKYDGEGVLLYANEEQVEYKGEFKNGNFHGAGTFYALDGTMVKSGTFKNEAPIDEYETFGKLGVCMLLADNCSQRGIVNFIEQDGNLNEKNDDY